MKLPIVSRKKYEILKENNRILNEARSEADARCVKLQINYGKVRSENIELGNQIEVLNLMLDEKKKEIANLKRLLTKNGIKYKKEK